MSDAQLKPQVNDPRLQQVLAQLQNFGFSFYGFDESGKPMVLSSNGQVIDINLAINFVNQQIKIGQAQSSGGSPESMPTPEDAPTRASPERSVETKLEQALDSSMESKQEKQAQQANQQQSGLQVQQKAPQVQLKPAANKPYGDGFDPKSFNPQDIKQTLQFIEENARKSNTSSNKWLSIKFRKFVEEARSGLI